MTTETITSERLLEATQAVLNAHPRGVSHEQAVVIAAGELAGAPLDPYRSADAAIILRAEQLLVDGLTVNQALAVAVREWAASRDLPPGVAA